MIEKLRATFPSLTIEKELSSNTNMEYFRMEDGHYIGIDKKEIDQKNRNILSIFLTPVHVGQNLSPLQSLWQDVLLSKNNHDSIKKLQLQYEANSSIRFIHFHLQSEVERTSFEEAMSSLSSSHYTIVWMNSISGVIVEEKKPDSISKDDLLDFRNAIASDFYTDVYLFLGDYFKIDEHSSNTYEFEMHCFELARKLTSNQTVFQTFDIIPYLLLQDATIETTRNIERYVADCSSDELHSVKTYIECGLNISLAAKQLFMHRNSLMYKVDKFIEKTGIDIKSFRGALVVYLAILSKKS